MIRVRYRCIVCGRKFPEGQGIVIKYNDLVLSFHSSRCASKFLKRLLEIVPYEDLGKYIREIYSEYEDLLKKKEELRAKRI